MFWHFSNEYLENPSTYYKLFAIFTLLLKDNNLIATSLGKLIIGISIVYLKNHRKASPLLFPLRHLITAFSLTLFLFAYEVQFVTGIVLLLFLVCTLDFILQLDTSRKMIDYILGTAIRQNNKRYHG